MTIIYSQNFDALTPPALPSGFTAITGTWVTTTGNPVSSPNALVNSPAVDGQVLLNEAITALKDMSVRYDVDVQNGLPGAILRMDSGYQNGYTLVVHDETFQAFDVYKRVGGAYTQLGTISSGYLGATTAGTQLSVRAQIQGTTLGIKVWTFGTTEPGSFAQTLSDSSITAAGYSGWYNNVPASTTGGSTIDNVTVDNLSSLAVSPASVSASSTGNSLTLTGTGTAWTSGTPGSPTFTVSGGTIIAQTVASATSATLTFNAPGTGGTVTITDPITGATASLTINGTATDFTLAPSTQTTGPGTATGNYTVTPNGTPSSSTTIALSDGGHSGTFKNASGTTITSLTFTASTAQTFTYTPSNSASPGTITLSATGTGGFSATHTTNCVVSSGPLTIAVTNASLFFSPGNWDHLTIGTFGVSTDTMQATAPGAYLKFSVSGTVNLTINIDNSTNSGFPSGDMPTLRYSIDNAAFTDVQLSPSATSLALSTSLSTGSHSVEIYFKASSNTSGYANVWGSSGVSPTNVLRINGIVIDNAGSVSASTLQSKRMLIFGDSITAGEHVNTDGSDDCTQSFAPMLARALNAEFGQLGYGGQGWEVTGGSNIPPFKNVWNLYSAGRNRSFSGLDYVSVVQGTNDQRGSVSGSTIQADLQTWLSSIRAALGSGTVIFVIVPPCACYESNLSAGVSAYKTASGDTKVFLVDAATLLPSGVFTTTFGGTTEWTYDGVHPLIFGHGRIGACYAAQASAALNPSLSTTVGYPRSRLVNA